MTIDELDKILVDTPADDTQAVDHFFENIWMELNRGHKIDEQLTRINNRTLQNSAGDQHFTALSYFTNAYSRFFAADYQSSVVYAQQAIEIFEGNGDGSGIAISNVVLGNSFRSIGSTEPAIQCYLRAQHYRGGRYTMADLGSSYQLAEVYIEIGKYEDALPLLDEALVLARGGKVALWWEPRIVNSKANALVKLGRTTQALVAFKAALRLSNKRDFKQVAARILTDMADYYINANDAARAIRYNKKALAIRNQLNVKNAVITNLLNLAHLYELQNDDKKALKYLSLAEPVAQLLGMRTRLARIHNSFSAIYQREGDYVASLKHYKNFHEMNEHASMEDTDQKINDYKSLINAEQTIRENKIIRKQKDEIEFKNLQLQTTVNELTLARDQIKTEKQRSEDLLLNILPAEVAEELKNTGTAEAKLYKNVTVLFTDFKGFTHVAERLPAKELVAELHACFSMFDEVVAKYNIEKIKTVGDAYLAVCGLPMPEADHARKTVLAAIEIRDRMLERRRMLGELTFEVRIGIHTGSVVAGIVGNKKFAYDIWGDTVNTAARMEQSSEAGKINISQSTFLLLDQEFNCTFRGKIQAKNKGEMNMYFVNC